jgi:aminocarboxymuconate-semialdehyde decarboxylase
MAPSFYAAIEALPGVARRADPFGWRLERDGRNIVGLNEEWFKPDAHIRDMDRKGIDIRLVAISTPNLYIFDPAQQAEIAKRVNDETIAYCEKRFDRLRALASLPLGDPQAALEELERVTASKTVVGISIGSNVSGVPLSDARFEPVWARLSERGINVVEHPVHPTFSADLQDMNLSVLAGFMFDTQLMIIRLIMHGVLERHRNLKLLVAHTGAGLTSILHRFHRAHTFLPDARAHMKKPFTDYVKELHFDTCINNEAVTMEAHRLLGGGRLMWGTDYPFVETTRDLVERMPLARDEKDAILGGNAARFFGLA